MSFVLQKYFILIAIAVTVISVLFVNVPFFLLDKSKELDGKNVNISIETEEFASTNNSLEKYTSDHYSLIKKRFLLSSGFVESESGKATSESQSYMMLMAVYMNDQTTFDSVFNWTKNNLQTRKEDKLFSWLWKEGGIVDENPATDADQDIAYALYLAYQRWGDEFYLQSAKEIVRDIWNVETRELSGVRYVTAGNWATKFKNSVLVNPSYLAPYQYRVFGVIDLEHDWKAALDSSYVVLNLCSHATGLARNWCQINSEGQVIEDYVLAKGAGATYSFDALRVPYRIAMDYLLNSEPRALEYLKKNQVFRGDWKNYGKIFARYDQAGGYIEKNESLASYGAQLASFSIIDEAIATEIFNTKINSIKFWLDKNFYDMSWIYFGLNFYTDYLRRDEAKKTLEFRIFDK